MDAPRIRPIALAAALVAAGALGACVEPSRPTLRVSEGADSVQVVAGDGQFAYVQRPVDIPPTVVVKDADGFRMPGVRVRFATTPGNGTVTGAEQVTDSLGQATVGSWVVGEDSGQDTLVAYVVAGAAARSSRTDIVANVTDLCASDLRPYAIGTTVQDVIAEPACLTVAEGLANSYEFTLTQPTIVQAQVITDSLRPYLDVTDASGTLVALANDEGPDAGIAYVPLPTGTWRLRAGVSLRSGGTGYTLQSSAVADLPDGCLGSAFLVRGSQLTSTIRADDCTPSVQISGVFSGTAAADRFFVTVVDTSVTYTVRAAVGGADAMLLLATPAGQLVALDDNGGGGTNPTLRFNIAERGGRSGIYALFLALKGLPPAPVTYTLSIDR